MLIDLKTGLFPLVSEQPAIRFWSQQWFMARLLSAKGSNLGVLDAVGFGAALQRAVNITMRHQKVSREQARENLRFALTKPWFTDAKPGSRPAGTIAIALRCMAIKVGYECAQYQAMDLQGIIDCMDCVLVEILYLDMKTGLPVPGLPETHQVPSVDAALEQAALATFL